MKERVVFAVLFLIVFVLGSADADNNTGTSAGLQSGIQTGIQQGIQADVQQGIQAGVQSGVQAGVQAGIQSGIQQGIQAGLQSNGNESAELKVDAGITPDSNFYFIDQWFSGFSGDLENREEKIAEVKAMVEAGKIEEAKEALARYEKYADKIGEEISPEESEEAKRSSEAIRNTIEGIESKIPEDSKKEFEAIKEKEGKIKTAAEISSKIKELCETLSSVDPKEYSEVCRTSENSPKWQKRLDEKLTEEQKKEARDFEKIMLQCMQTEGKQCRCEEISIKPFAEKCSLVAPLASKCEDGDEEACTIMEEATQNIEDLLPPHLQEVLFTTEEKIRGEQFDHFTPPECKKAGATNAKECMAIMFKENAPEECKKALEEGKINPDNEREARMQCEEIMFKENAPEECIEVGIKNGKACGTFMCEKNLPEECKDAGLSCEQPNKVFRKCEEIMKGQGKNRGPGNGKGFAFGRNCMSIENKDEKLKCFEETFNKVQEQGFPGSGPEHFGEFGDEGRGTFPEECRQANALTDESCRKVMMQVGEKRRKQTRDFQENFARECRAKGGAWDCSYGDIDSSNPCRCFVEERREEFKPREFNEQDRQRYEEERRKYEEQYRNQYPNQPSTTQPSSTTAQAGSTETQTSTESGQTSTQTSTETTTTTQTPTDSATSSTSSNSATTSSSGTSSTSTSTSSSGTSTSSSGSSDSGSTTSSPSPTGGVILDFDNKFLDYFYK